MTFTTILSFFVVLCFSTVSAFTSTAYRRTTAITSTSRELNMAGGRNQAEVGASKKQMFVNVREKLNNAAKIPGFFDVGNANAVSSSLSLSHNQLDVCNLI